MLEILKEEAARLARPAHRWCTGNGGDDALVARDGGRLVGVRGKDARGAFVAWRSGARWVAEEPPEMAWRPVAVEPFTSFPSIDDIFVHGDERVARWLAQHGWCRDWPFNANFGGRADVERYEAWWMSSHPFYLSDAIAIAGGWPFPWPDEDGVDRAGWELLLWVCENEPFVELWRDRGALRVVEHVT